MTTPMLEMTDIVKVFPGTRACDGATLEVRAGEVHCLIGENGAGKSTLMKILAGSYQPDSGRISIAGRTVELHTPHDGMAAGVSVIYQELDLVPDMTVAQNLFLGHAPSRGPLVKRAERLTLARQAIERVGGRFPMRSLVRDLTVADQQLTAIAKALTVDARLIVMDEPSATLTEHDLEAVFALIRRLASEGRSIVYISHRLDEVKEIGDRATVMRDGRTVAVFDVKDTTTDTLVTAMIGRPPTAERRPVREGTTGDPLLDVRHVRISGLLDVEDLTVHPGEVVGLAGLGGAGRTTLLAALFGALPAQIDATIAGRPLVVKSPRSAVRQGMGLVPEDRKRQGLLRELSIRRNVALAALRPGGLHPKRVGARAAKAPLSDLGVRYASVEQPVGQLSGGNQQKVVLAKWIARGVKLLLLDEPTRGLDIGAKEDLFRQVHRLAGEGVGVLLASSELSELTANADVILVLHEGRKIAKYDPRHITEDEIARAIVTGSAAS